MNLSNIFKYISFYRQDGHSIGRKIGDLLEVIVFGSMLNNNKFDNKIITEPKLFGFCGSGHKVEFAISKEATRQKGGNLENLNKLAGFIECKKVGVEQTINTSFKKKYLKKNFLFKDKDKINFTFEKNIIDISFNKNKEIFYSKINLNDQTIFEENLKNFHRFIFLIDENNKFDILKNDQSLKELKTKIKKCKILEIEIKNSNLYCKLNDCLPGPQTPEKAKQASFVGLDARKLRYGYFDKAENEKDFKSILVLTEFDHWELKSRNMINACIDLNFYVDDDLLIKCCEEMKEEFGQNFWNLISKNEFENNNKFKQIIFKIIERENGQIYSDINSKHKYKINFDDVNKEIIFA